jgi:acetolactate synthase-1/2/3 large subunit
MNHLVTLAHQIAASGLRHVFGIPGSGPILVLLDTLERAGVRFHLTHFEGSAALMAGAVGKLSGQSGVSISIKGPGLTNMVPGLAACALESFPVVSISEAYLPGTPPQKCHKRMDHFQLLAAIAKHHQTLSTDAPHFAELAGLAEDEPPGVVHLDVSESPFDTPGSLQASSDVRFDRDGLRRATDLLRRARRPIVIAGTLAIRKGWSARLNRLSLPIFSTAAAKGAVDERLPHAAGVYTGVGGPLAPERSILPEADLVVALGLRHNEVLAVHPFAYPSLHIDPLGVTRSFGFEFDCHLEGSDAEIEEVFGGLEQLTWGSDLTQTSQRRLSDKMFSGPFLPAHVFRRTAEHFHDEVRVVLDTGNFCTIGEHAWPVSRPDLYLASGQGRYMGIGIPLGIGAAFHDPNVPTAIVTGDGGIGMFAAEMKLASQNKLPLLLILMSDGHLGTIRAGALSKGLSQKPTVIPQPSWLKAMEGMGVPGVCVDSRENLERALKDWGRDGPLYIEIMFDADQYQAMTEGIR